MMMTMMINLRCGKKKISFFFTTVSYQTISKDLVIVNEMMTWYDERVSREKVTSWKKKVCEKKKTGRESVNGKFFFFFLNRKNI